MDVKFCIKQHGAKVTKDCDNEEKFLASYSIDKQGIIVLLQLKYNHPICLDDEFTHFAAKGIYMT